MPKLVFKFLRILSFILALQITHQSFVTTDPPFLNQLSYDGWEESLRRMYRELPNNFYILYLIYGSKEIADGLARVMSFTKEYECLNLQMKPQLESIDRGYRRMVACMTSYSIDPITEKGVCNDMTINFWAKELYSPSYISRFKLVGDLEIMEYQYAKCLDSLSNHIMALPITENICPTEKSIQTIFTDAFIDVALAYLKGYAFIKTLLLYEYNHGNQTTRSDLDLIDWRLKNRLEEVEIHMNATVKRLSRDIYNCDSTADQRSGRFASFNTHQKFLVNDLDLRRHDTLKGVQVVKFECLAVGSCFDNLKKCRGLVTDCKKITQPAEMSIFKKPKVEVCPSEDKTRRYDYITYIHGDSALTFGQKRECSKSAVQLNMLASNGFWWFGEDQYLRLCTCVEIGDGGSKINLNEALSDVEKNKVVTGVRFVFEKDLLSIQIEQGVLKHMGKIEQNSTIWKAIDDEPGKSLQIEGTNSVIRQPNFFKIGYLRDKVYLDELDDVDSNSLLTGLKFVTVENSDNELAIKLAIRLTPFNFTSGELDFYESTWISSNVTDERRELKLFTERLEEYNRNFHANQFGYDEQDSPRYIRFQTSDLDLDVGQRTVPFIDREPVEPRPRIPISGAGIYHRDGHEEEGFLGLKLISYDRSQHGLDLLAKLPKQEMDLMNRLN